MGKITSHIGFIGGSGLEQLIDEDDGYRDVKTYNNIVTPYGIISQVQAGTLGSKRVYFISRHGREREYSPNEAPYNAYLWFFANVKIIETFMNDKAYKIGRIN